MSKQPTTSFYMRELPPSLIAFSSSEGKEIFKEALADGTMECYFVLSEQFSTQSEPAFCGLTTLTITLNALGVDPHRIWKGPWRWFSEEMLDCCKPLEITKKEGINYDEFICLAHCNGALVVDSRRGDDKPAAFNLDAFRANVIECTQTPSDELVLAVSFDRQVLGQTGSGHFSLIGGYSRARDLVLILDVARFKYPPYWVPVATLFEAMRTLDSTTGRARGYFNIKASPAPPFSALVRIRWPVRTVESLHSIAAFIEAYVAENPACQKAEVIAASLFATDVCSRLAVNFAPASSCCSTGTCTAADGTLAPMGSPPGTLPALLAAGSGGSLLGDSLGSLTGAHFALCSTILKQVREVMRLTSTCCAVRSAADNPSVGISAAAAFEHSAVLTLVSDEDPQLRLTVDAVELFHLAMLAFPLDLGLLSETAAGKVRTMQSVVLPRELAAEVDAMRFKLRQLCEATPRAGEGRRGAVGPSSAGPSLHTGPCSKRTAPIAIPRAHAS
eukprot:c14850_g1_i1.p1 GENE.c14850_g1_i1~~c14850_g1_i1.p1  ORF type:complete len:502 (+),score=72.69 c14850_g1_i1:152-1657(+)